MHSGPLIAILVAGIVLAFLFGALAHRVRISPLVGYLLAGVVLGPFTPGYVADQKLATELAEVGVILLMFGVGLHFSLADLLSVRAVAVPGALGQIVVATAMGAWLGHALGWSWGAGLVFGLALSVASTVVLLRALGERRLVDTQRGRIAVGWLIVEDLAMVLALVLIPALSGGGTGAGLGWALALTLGKVAAFVALMLVVGQRVIPWALQRVAQTGSRELFRLAVLALALGVAFGAAALFEVSFALGAFFAGMVLSESELSHQAAEDTLPLRDAFAVLFFVSVGMLFDPGIVLRAPWQLAATLAIIVAGKFVAAYVLVRLFRRPVGTALLISVSLAQIGEFSFILAALGAELHILPDMARDLILAGAILSILLNPILFIALDRVLARLGADAKDDAAEDDTVGPAVLAGHTVLIGYGRVGALVGAGLRRAGQPFLVIEDHSAPIQAARADGAAVLRGNAAVPAVLAAANLAVASRLFVAIPNSFEAGQVIAQARAANPALEIIARSHSDAETGHLERCGATLTIMGEAEIARRMLAVVSGNG